MKGRDEMKHRFVVIGEHTLGLIAPRMPDVIQVMATSVIRGATYGSQYDNIHKPWPDMRPATRADFKDFRLSVAAYENNPQYDFPAA